MLVICSYVSYILDKYEQVRGVSRMEKAKKRIAVVGSGITGLTVAYRLQQTIKEQDLPYEVIVLIGISFILYHEVLIKERKYCFNYLYKRKPYNNQL